MAARVFDYTPSPTVAAFLRDKSNWRVLVGAVGSGKSCGSLMALFMNAIEQEPLDGVRRTRSVLVRNTYSQLIETTLKTALALFAGVCTYKSSTKTLQFRFPHPSGDGTTVESDWLLLSLEDQSDTAKLLSLELTSVFINEAREISLDIIRMADSRIGRYPAVVAKRNFEGATFPCLVMDSNPPVIGSEFHELCVNPPPNTKVFYQPPAVLRDPGSKLGWKINPEAENLENLHKDYYKDMLIKNKGNDEFIRVYLGGEFARSMAGEPVFGKIFHYDFHVSPEPLSADITRPLIVGMDFGLNPAAVVCQHSAKGQLLVLHELFGENIPFNTFIQQMFLPLMYERFKELRVCVVGDPSGLMRSALAGNESMFSRMKALGIDAIPAKSNFIDVRVQSLEPFLLGQVDGKGKLLIDAVNCPQLISALSTGYRFKRSQSGNLADTPEKNHPDSDLVDSLMYVSSNIDNPRLHHSLHGHRPPPPTQALDLSGWV